jgi:hypothetical protein
VRVASTVFGRLAARWGAGASAVGRVVEARDAAGARRGGQLAARSRWTALATPWMVVMP